MRLQMLALALTFGLTGAAFGQARVLDVGGADNAAPTGSIPQDTPAAPAAPAPATVPAPAAAPSAPPVPPQQAQQQTPPPSRFRFEKAKDGFLRLDDQTGQVAFCNQHPSGWACEAVPEDRTALEKEIGRQQDAIARQKEEAARQQAEIARQQNEVARLQSQLADLTKEVASLREPPPPPHPPAELSPPPPPKEGDKNSLTLRLPTQEDLDRAAAALQNAWDRIVDMIGNLKKDLSRKGQADHTTL
jgi:hypothetical protein